ncbi:MAG TPA: cytochrome C [Porticoccaceae bacterium]|nr:cytochrome C [Porticoccaceae bacterium]
MAPTKLNQKTSRRRLSSNMGFNAVVFMALSLTLPATALGGADDTPAVDWGRDLYMSFCVSCHGWTGKGDGPAGPALTTPPADLTQLSARNGGKFPRTKIQRYLEGELPVTAHGSREMPIWGNR